MQPKPPAGDLDQVALLRQALEAQSASAQALDHALATYGETMARLVIYGVDRWCDIAGNPRHPGQLAAKQLLRAWVATMDRAREMSSTVEVARELPGRTNGSK